MAFGASDDILYEKTLPKLMEMKEQGKPFYAQIISMSAHHPFDLPESKVMLNLPENLNDTLMDRYFQAQHYADQAIGEFIADLKSSGLWDNSIVMFYGDHQGLPIYSLSKNERNAMEGLLGHEYQYPDMFNIPFILHAPGMTDPAVISKTGGQADILPTVANLTGISMQDQISFRCEFARPEGTADMLPMRHFLPSGSLITDTNIYMPGNEFDDGTD